MPSSISLARRSAASPTNVILHLPFKAAVERRAIEPNEPSVTDERQLQLRDLVVKRKSRHAQVLRGRVDIEPARRDDRTHS